MQYTYDMMNNRTSGTAVIDDRGTKKTICYRYDHNGRLVEKKADAGDGTLSVENTVTMPPTTSQK